MTIVSPVQNVKAQTHGAGFKSSSLKRTEICLIGSAEEVF